MNELLKRSFINSNELETLLKEREENKADFILVDVREQIEYDMSHIKGIDILQPSSSFHSWSETFFNENRDKTVILTCRTDYRSGNIQKALQQNGMERVINHSGGIASYRGEIVRS